LIVGLERQGIHGVVQAEGIIGDIRRPRRSLTEVGVNDVERCVADGAQCVGRLTALLNTRVRNVSPSLMPLSMTGTDKLADLAVGEGQRAVGGV
jgi:hypothetical protein